MMLKTSMTASGNTRGEVSVGWWLMMNRNRQEKISPIVPINMAEVFLKFVKKNVQIKMPRMKKAAYNAIILPACMLVK